jgi:inner membrane protein
MIRRLAGADSGSLTFRGLAVAGLTLLLLIPVGMVNGVIDERSARYQEVVEQVGAEWGGAQTVIGPILMLPFTERWETLETVHADDGAQKQIRRRQTREDVILVLPAELSITASLDAEPRQRGIYEAMVYAAPVTLTGRFARTEFASAEDRTLEVHWAKAGLAIAVSAPIGIHSVDTLVVSGGAQRVSPGSQLPSMPQGMHWLLHDARALADNGEFEIDMTLHGSAQIAFAPVGDRTVATISSKWPHPGFTGLSPMERRIDEHGFAANWSLSSLSRSYPQGFPLSDVPPSLATDTVGVRLVQPVFLYSLNDRAVKYAALFITLTFVTLLVFELVTAARVHYVQYALIGAALTMFYLLLLALSEHVGFAAAYAVAAATVVMMITAYAAAALGRWWHAALVGAMQTVTYAVLYVILQLEDFALITGTVALLAALGALMYFTRTLSSGEVVATVGLEPTTSAL